MDTMQSVSTESIEASGAIEAGNPERKRALAKIVIFLVLVAAFAGIVDFLRLSVPFGTKLIILAWTPHLADTLAMWSVGFAGAISLVLVDRSLKDFGLKAALPKYTFLAMAVPFATGGAIYLPVWILELGGFGGTASLGSATLSALIHFPMHLFAAAGEELGWRGVLVPNLARTAGSKTIALVPGAIWALWHYPDILFFDYNVGTPAIFALTCFSISVIGVGAFLSWLRLASGSIWPAVVFHGVHNSVILGIFDRVTDPKAVTLYITSEFGIGLSIVSAAVGCLCWFKLQSRRGLYRKE
jgi:membrane protease YdiL (CAAX protease family)